MADHMWNVADLSTPWVTAAFNAQLNNREWFWIDDRSSWIKEGSNGQEEHSERAFT